MILINLLGFIFALGIIVFIHELGHFSVAKIFGLYVSEFSLGFGPILWSHKSKETRYSLRAIPLGGFVSVVGEEDDKITPNEDDELDPALYAGRTVQDLNTFKKCLFTLAGVFMNFLLALAIMSSMLLSYKQIRGEIDTTIGSVVENYPAANAGLKAGDKILSMESHGIKVNFKNYDDLLYYMSMYEGDEDIIVSFKRGEDTLTKTLKPIKEDDSYLIGISFEEPEPINVTIWNCVPLAFTRLFSVLKATVNALRGLFRGIGLNNIGGPIAIYEVTSEAISLGFESYLSIIMSLSLNIGVMNLLPLPALDGGRTIIYIIEGIIGKKCPKSLENALMTISLAAIIALTVFVMFKDVFNIFMR